MKLLTKAATSLLAISMMTSCGLSTKSVRKQSARVAEDVFCPSTAFIDAQKTKNPPKDYEEFKRWVGALKGNEALVVDSYTTLRECWEFYHGAPKRTTGSLQERADPSAESRTE